MPETAAPAGLRIRFPGFRLTGRAILVLIILNLAAVAISVSVPQRMHMSAAELAGWRQANPVLAPLAERLGLHHVFTTTWFGLVLFLFFLALLVSLKEQVALAWRNTSRAADTPGAGPWQETCLALDAIAGSARRAGYVLLAGGDEHRRFGKNPWGYWGNATLHLGLVVTICASLLVVLFQQRGMLHLYEGEVRPAGRTTWIDEEHGLLADTPALPVAVELAATLPELWEETGELRQLTSEIRLLSAGGEGGRHPISVNKPISLHGYRVYQATQFGRVFFLEIYSGGQEPERVLVEIEHPRRKGEAGYGSFSIEGTSIAIKSKYLDEGKRGRPHLILRLVAPAAAPAELALRPGETGVFGQYRIRLLHAADWTALIFTRFPGMPGIFLGFFLIVAGSGLVYFFPARELYVKKEADRIYVQWRPGRFPPCYGSELDAILAGG